MHRGRPGMDEQLGKLIINIKRRKVHEYLAAKLPQLKAGAPQIQKPQPKPPPSGVTVATPQAVALSVNDVLRAFEKQKAQIIALAQEHV